MGYKNLLDNRVAVHHLRSTTSRTANYKMFYKNRIIFAIRNFPLVFLLKLPVIDMLNLWTGVTRAKNLNFSQVRGQKQTWLTSRIGKLGLALEMEIGLAYGYLWNLVFFPATLAKRSNRSFYDSK